MEPTEDIFRALARSSPWRFTTLHFTHRWDGRDPVEAWLTRPGHLRVRLVDGSERVAEGVPYTTGTLRLQDGASARPRRWLAREGPLRRRRPRAAEVVRSPQSVQPRLRPDGLVAQRPSEPDYDDPMWTSYAWVAMLDPVELSAGVEVADECDGRPGGGWADPTT